MPSSPLKRSVDIALSTSLFKRSTSPQKDIDKVEGKTRKRMEIAQKNYSSLNHDVFDSKHYQFTQQIKDKVKRIGAVAASKIDIARNTYYEKAGKLANQHQSQEITTDVYVQTHSLSMINADLTEALAYEEAIEKIVTLTGLIPKYAGDAYDFSKRKHTK
jgi:hypothetical protein